MRRRDFMGLAGWAAVLCPLAVNAQQANKVYRIGYISAGVRLNSSVLQDSLSKLGWIEGKNLIYERRYADNRKPPRQFHREGASSACGRSPHPAQPVGAVTKRVAGLPPTSTRARSSR